jgi:Raf kinase inhibitor-like YbhB/YbcL family protein
MFGWIRRSLLAAIALTGLALAGPAAAMTLASADVAEGAAIGARHIYPRCGGQNRSPALAWSGAPAATRSYAVTVIDVDVKPSFWSHWILLNLPAAINRLPQGVQAAPAGAVQIATDFGETAYGGPCPPRGTGVHHYQITVWAFAQPHVQPPRGLTARALDAWLRRTSIDRATITGTVTG